MKRLVFSSCILVSIAAGAVSMYVLCLVVWVFLKKNQWFRGSLLLFLFLSFPSFFHRYRCLDFDVSFFPFSNAV